jgi:hypothetical protein
MGIGVQHAVPRANIGTRATRTVARAAHGPIIPAMIKLMLVVLMLTPALFAQGIVVEAQGGVGGHVAPPCTEVRVTIAKQEQRAFVGRIVIDLSEPDPMSGRRRGRSRGTFASDVLVTQDVNLEEGSVQRTVRMEVPVATTSVDATVRIERLVSNNYYETAAETTVSEGGGRQSNRKLVGFISPVRVAGAQPFLFFDVVEIPVVDVPESWKALAGFDAIILNDDSISRAQARALVDYVTMGGTLLISPRSNASFNPETPAGTLLRVSSTTSPQKRPLKEFPDLLKALQAGGFAPSEEVTVEPGRTGDPPSGIRESTPIEAPGTPVVPDTQAEFAWWPDPAHTRPLPSGLGLVSHTPVGAGNVVLMHVNLGDYPFQEELTPTVAGVNLIQLAMGSMVDRVGRTPFHMLADDSVRSQVDIAANRIPGREVLVLLLLAYVCVAGVGMFLLARRIKRPELYPAALVAAALVSVGLVFSFGELYKRAGDRVKAARIVVTDNGTGRSAVFTMGCSYAVDSDELRYKHPRESLLTPARFRTMTRGMQAANDVFDYTSHFTATEVETEVQGLDRWQNVFFMHRQRGETSQKNLRVETLEGAWRVTNLGAHTLRGCMFIVGGGGPAGQRCRWFYAAQLEPNATFTFSESEGLEAQTLPLAARLEHDLDSRHSFRTMVRMLDIDPDDRVARSMTLGELEQLLWNSGLLPEDREFLMLCVLPADSPDSSTIGAQGVDESDISQVNVWAVRGTLEGR